MKKISIILVICILSALFLSACGTAPAPEKSEETPAVTEEIKETEPVLDTSYDIEIVGEKDENENGEVIGDSHFQKVVFTNPNSALKKINDEIAEESNEFFTEGMGKQYEEYFSQLTDEAKAGLAQQPYTAAYDVDNVFIDDKYVSITYVWDWYAGGVHNYGSKGFTFDISTGEEIDFEDLFASEADAQSTFEAAVNKLIDENPVNFFEDAKTTVSNYDIDDVKFSIDAENITVYIDQYEIAPGASGSFTITIAR